jgi:hypothetical protein
VAATLSLTRSGGFAIELRRGTFEYLVDGEAAGSIEKDQTVETPVDPGHHTLLVRAGRYSSAERAFDAADDEMVNFRCHGTTIWPRYLASFVLPNIGISLKRV